MTAVLAIALIYNLLRVASNTMCDALTFSGSRNQSVLSAALTEWHENMHQIPAVMQPLVKKLHDDAQNGTLSGEQCKTMVAALVAMSAGAVAQ